MTTSEMPQNHMLGGSANPARNNPARNNLGANDPATNDPVLIDLANSALTLWDVPSDARVRLINLSENATFVVENDAGFKSILRVHRPGYHTRRAIECEIEWMVALGREGRVVTPPVIRGIDGNPVQTFGTPKLSNRYLVMFEFLAGEEPVPDQDLKGPFHQLGVIAAKTHLHSMRWQRPPDFERLCWDDAAVFGADANWGDWRDAVGVDAEVKRVLEACETLLCQRLATYGQGEGRFGLIHADMRLANLLVHHGQVRLIDFDDCGFGWFMYDFAAGISFMEDHVQVPALKDAWVEGYQTIRRLDDADLHEIDTMVMLRRMALLAWMASHAETPLAHSLAGHFAPVSAELAERYLAEKRL